MTFLLLEHARKELLDENEVGDEVDFENLFEEHRWRIEYSLARA